MPPTFQPGFRPLSALDYGFLGGTLIAVPLLWGWSPELAAAILFVIIHFFGFCNVFRLARSLELWWTTINVVLAGIVCGIDAVNWQIGLSLSVLSTLFVVALEIRSPRYHGIGWRLINPALPE